MIDLHERLSEYSYGYGVTRETEKLLEQMGIRAVPFLPNLIHENKLGFDVAFDRPGTALMLQFKLGQTLKRFHKNNPTQVVPLLNRPFWRFTIDTAEPDGQFETLLKAEQDGAEVYYVAPRFTDWPEYADLFERTGVLENSVLVKPSEIRSSLDEQGSPEGHHRIVYDRYRVHVCSEPTRVREMDSDDAIEAIAINVREKRESAGAVLERLLVGFDDRSSVRRVQKVDLDNDRAADSYVGYRSSSEFARNQRRRRFENLLKRTKSHQEAVAAAVGIELWAQGVQLVVAVDEKLTTAT